MKIAIIGAGNMGSAIACGLAAYPGEYEICVSNPSREKLEKISGKFPSVKVTDSNLECARHADMIVLAVKPAKIMGILQELKALWESKNIAAAASANCCNTQCGWNGNPVTIISLAAIVSLEQLREYCGEFPAIYRAIPNTAANVGRSVTFIATDRHYEDIDEDVAGVFEKIGCVEMIEEDKLGAGMAVASCGMAFMMRMLRAMTEGGVELGLSPRQALRAAAATMGGAAALIAVHDSHPEEEVDRVTTPGGLTIRGVNTMEESGFSAAVIKGLRACVKSNV